jgi:hypothetical protein
MSQQFDTALELAEEMLIDSKDVRNYALISELVGESDRVGDAVLRVLSAGKDCLADAQKSLQEAVVEYLRTDVKANEIADAQAHSDWIDSGLSRAGLIKRAA